MSLSDIWFVLFIVIVAGYLILDGFDMGVGILHLVVARSDEERRIVLNSIGPVWDGNEVWLVLAAGVLFAGFPLVYASLFSGFYLALTLVLLTLIVRAVSIEFRSKESGTRWRSAWDTVFGLSSLGLALLLGVAFGDIISGVPLDADGNIQVSLIALLSPFALLFGVTTVVMFAMHGGIYLSIKSEGELQARVRAWVPRIMAAFVVLLVALVVTLLVSDQQIATRYKRDIWLVVVPIAAIAALTWVWYMLRHGREFAAFVASSAVIGLLIISAGIGIYPNLLISTTNAAYNLTTTNASAADNTLGVMLIVAVIGMPFVILYTAGVYYFFRGKTRLDPHSY